MSDVWRETGLSDGGAHMANVSEHILDLIAITCRSPERLGDSTHSAIRAGRVAAILGYIAQRFRDPDLTVDAVASANGISVRYLQLMFKGLDTSFSAKVNEQRLLYAQSLLANPKLLKLHVSDVALRSGFSDVSYFNRRFKLRFGTTPNGLRSEIAGTQY
jgi:AraC-like DNA-binding protein